LAVGVPGSVAGLEYAREKYGTRSRGVLIAPGHWFCRARLRARRRRHRIVRHGERRLQGRSGDRGIFLNKGQPYKAGDRLGAEGPGENSCAWIAQRGPGCVLPGLDRRRDRGVERDGNGIITKADLQRYKVRELAPVECDYRGYHIVSAPPPSSGGVVVCEILNILEGYQLKDLGFRSAQAVHYQNRSDAPRVRRSQQLSGDPDFVKNPLDRLLDKGYAEKVRAAIDPNKAGVSRDLKPGRPPHEGHQHDALFDRRQSRAMRCR
jgi:gamma-glutamyltranspeptidase/glutathione hydrolase